MALELFVDTITVSISLRVSSKILKDTTTYKSSIAFDFFPKALPTSTLVESQSKGFTNNSSALYTPFIHNYNSLNKNVLNIVSLNVKKSSFNLTQPTKSYTIATTSDLYPEELPLNTLEIKNTKTYLSDETSFYIQDSTDFVDLDWNVNTNRVYDISKDFDPVDPDPGGGGNNNQSTIKEFWA